MCNTCSKRTVDQIGQRINRSKETDRLSGKNIIDSNGNKLLVTDAIRDVYGDIIGYITLNESGQTIRIFARNVAQIIEKQNG
jgi:hypothetical protein